MFRGLTRKGIRVMNKLPKLIGLMGNRGAGKTVISHYLATKYHFVARGFADPLYEILATLNPIIQTGTSLTTPQHHYYTDLVEEYGIDYTKRAFTDVRRYLQLLGTECGRDVHGPNTWVNAMECRSRADTFTAIHDVRFPNEVEWIRSVGGVLWHVTSPRETPADKGHASEVSLDYAANADYTIHNDGTLEQLYDKVETVLDRYTWKMDV